MADDIRENDVAIVGMACRFPGANDVREYWDNLVKGVEAIRFLTDDELRAAGVPERFVNDPNYVKACPMIDDMDGFDAAFFGYTARDAELRDPQGRLFLETCHSALEDAGYDVGRYSGTVGVFGGAGEYRYGSDNVRRNGAAVDAAGGMSVATATEPDYLATTVSYRLGLQGPSFTVQTACSTALVAIHLGCQSLQMGECDMALVGAVDVRLPYGRGHWRVDGGIGSADGHVRAFDAAASGTIFGSGVGVLAVKRLADARADGDHVYAVIRGSAINNDGAARAGYTAPGVEGQTRLIVEALAVAQVPPETIGYVEAHGTGTLVGDPIEVTALSDAFRAAGATAAQYCALGSVKTNVGHLGAAAGVAGIIKACLAVRHGVIPPTLHFQEPNPAIDFESSPFYVNTEPVPWTGPRRAGVSSFGIGGTNAHIVLEEPPEHVRVPDERSSPQVIALSARTGGALAAMAARLGEHLGEPDPPPLADVAWTLQHGRREFPYRRTVVAATVQDAAAALRDLAGAAASTRPVPVDGRGVALLFPGQGAQYPGMGEGLYRTQKAFRTVIDDCAEVLEPLIGADLRDLLYGGAPDEALARTRLAQPALFAVEYAVARLFASWGVVPDALLGHSIGEYTAACLAGVMSFEDALAVVAARGELMQGMPPGSMAAVPLPEHLVVPMLLGGVEVAAVNGPAATVVAGPDAAVDAFEKRLAPWGVRCGRLVTSHAFHSGMMDAIVEPFRERVASVRLNEPRIPFLSNVTGTWITAEQATDPGYWAAHLRSAVRFADCVRALADGADRVLLEAGPGRTLTGAARQCLPGARTVLATSMRHPLGEGDDEVLALEALGRLWSAGVPVGWDGAASGDRRRVPLPVYPFERRRYWLDPDPAGTAGQDAEEHDEGARPVERAVYAPVWTERPIGTEIPAVPDGSRWLVLTPGTGPVEDLADRLEAEGARVVRVTAGPGFAETGADRFAVRPAERDDYEALLGALGDGAFPTHVVHGWTATAAEPDPLAPEAVERACDLGFYSLLLLAQALEDRLPDEPVRIVAVSTNMQDVSGEGANEPGKATLLGPAILMNRELRHVGCRSVDLAAPARQPADVVTGQLLRECLRDDDADRQVAWRGLKRWAWSYTGVPVEVPEEKPAVLREGGTYLITGGLGGIGLTTARELARTARANLVLLGRTAPPDRDAWPALLADEGTDEATRRLLGELAEIEELGGTVLARACDVTDEDALAAAVAEAVERFGRVDGVFHSAGVAGGGLLAVRDREAARRVLAPKVAGTLALHRVLGDDVDFVVLYSSITSVVGDFGQVDYCAANNFLDSYARRRAASGARVLSVSWGAWRDVGMAVDAARITPNVFREMRGGKWSEPAEHPLLGRRLHDLSDDVVFSTVLGPESHWMLTDHRVGAIPLMPGSGCLEMIRAAAVTALGAAADEHVEMTDVVFLGPIEVRTDQEMRITLRPAQDGFHDASFTVAPADTDDPAAWTERVRARVRTVPATPAPVHDVEAVRAECADHRFEPTPDFRSRGIVDFGPHWYSVERVDIGARRQLGTVALPEEFRAECGQYVLHPGLFDDAVSNARVIEGIRKGNKYLPLSYRRILVRAPLPPRFHVDVRELDDAEGEIVAADIRVMAPDGTELAEIEQYALRRVDPAAFAEGAGGDEGAPAEPGPAGAPAPAAAPDRADWMITPATGMDALRALLGAWGAAPHLVVCPEGLEANLRRVESLTGDVLERELGDGAVVATTAAQGERLLDTPYAAPETPLQQRIAALWSDAFGIREIGLDDDFAELGGNSLMAVQLAWRVRQHFDVEVTVARLFRRPTVRALAELVENEQGAR
ncbi:type I polyketide synthase [Actinomadura verrucosospora]|uniref:6-deoxyerythronolide-B synthase, Aspartate racemase n=1 Tax=Actinomadura verrucosospora TaxID=46165 RepID=A0A7D4A2T3_ACTVE|nr:type I polyketide synthase [Actinomadura verrucosospora]QKG27206.1 6-deoxyerythronolide-B synthase, Aspartate racemase [Actinomadura verrucosospora]